MEKQASDESSGNDAEIVEQLYIIQEDVKKLARKYPVHTTRFSIALLEYRMRYLRPELKDTAQWTIQCLKYNLAWDCRKLMKRIIK